jgi:hypothetical protein
MTISHLATEQATNPPPATAAMGLGITPRLGDPEGQAIQIGAVKAPPPSGKPRRPCKPRCPCKPRRRCETARLGFVHAGADRQKVSQK